MLEATRTLFPQNTEALHYAARFKMCLQLLRKVEPTDSAFRNHLDNVKVTH